RVDFRELIKRMAESFRIRIEMRQIGMRQEASRLGGIGSCGRELCCSTWLTDFKTVSTSAARYQNLSLNTLKLAGQCGKLKCCLNYELDRYIDDLKDIPNNVDRIETTGGMAYLQKTDIFKKTMWYSYPGAESWIPLHVSKVKEFAEMNKNGQKPSELVAPQDPKDEVTKPVSYDYENVVGQDSLTRLDDKNRKKKRKKSKPKKDQQTTTDTKSANAGPKKQQQDKQAQAKKEVVNNNDTTDRPNEENGNNKPKRRFNRNNRNRNRNNSSDNNNKGTL